MKTLNNYWTVRNIQLVIILGLIAGIAIQSLDLKQYLPTVEAVTYIQEQTACDYKCAFDKELVVRTERIYNEQKAHNMEMSRLEALQEMGTVVASQMDNSPYVDYANLAETYGYSE